MADRSTYYDSRGNYAFSILLKGNKECYAHAGTYGKPLRGKKWGAYPIAVDFQKEIDYFKGLIGKKFSYRYENGNKPRPIVINSVDDSCIYLATDYPTVHLTISVCEW